MAFLRKKKVKFSVALVVEKLTDVPLLNAVIFAKVFCPLIFVVGRLVWNKHRDSGDKNNFFCIYVGSPRPCA